MVVLSKLGISKLPGGPPEDSTAGYDDSGVTQQAFLPPGGPELPTPEKASCASW